MPSRFDLISKKKNRTIYVVFYFLVHLGKLLGLYLEINAVQPIQSHFFFRFTKILFFDSRISSPYYEELFGKSFSTLKAIEAAMKYIVHDGIAVQLKIEFANE